MSSTRHGHPCRRCPPICPACQPTTLPRTLRCTAAVCRAGTHAAAPSFQCATPFHTTSACLWLHCTVAPLHCGSPLCSIHSQPGTLPGCLSKLFFPLSPTKLFFPSPACLQQPVSLHKPTCVPAVLRWPARAAPGQLCAIPFLPNSCNHCLGTPLQAAAHPAMPSQPSPSFCPPTPPAAVPLVSASTPGGRVSIFSSTLSSRFLSNKGRNSRPLNFACPRPQRPASLPKPSLPFSAIHPLS